MRLFMGVLVLTILPFAAFAGEGRYQGVPNGGGGQSKQHSGIFVVDTKTGKVIKWCSPYGCEAIKDNVKN